MAAESDAWMIEDVVVFDADEVDLSSWEMIGDDSDSDEHYSYDGEDDDEEVESLSSDLSARSPPHDLIIDRCNDHEINGLDAKDVEIDEQCGYYENDHEEEEEEEEDEYDDDGYGYDFDDELVPNSVSDRFGKQRMKKSGKRASSYPKMSKSRGVPCYYYNRPR